MKTLTAFSLFVAFCVPGTTLGEEISNTGDQLERVLRDRPQMRGIFPDDDVVVRWVERRFETGRSGHGVVWDDKEPTNGLAEHESSFAGKPALVRVTKREDVSGRDKWYMLVFELFNEFHPLENEAFDQLAASGTVDRVQFASAVLNHEYQRMLVANRFFKRYPILGATPENAPLYTQYMGIFDETRVADAEDQSKTIPKPSSEFAGHYEHYGQWYDTVKRYGPRKAEPSRAPEHSFTGLLKAMLSARAR